MNKTDEIGIHADIKPGLIGAIVRLHGELYALEYGWDWTFEAYVAEGLSKFALNYDPKRDRIWVVEGATPPDSPPSIEGGARLGQTGMSVPPQGGQARMPILLGCIAIAHTSETEAQLRWYLVHPAARGQGLGKQLMNDALQFCREVGYKSVFLWTTSDLKAAAHVYLSSGFRKAEEKTHQIWGKMVTEERYEMSLEV